MDQMPIPSGVEEILEKKKLELKSVVSELFSICCSQASLGQFLQHFLVSSIRLMEGIGGCLWVKRGEKLDIAFEAEGTKAMQPVFEGIETEEDLLEKVSQSMKPFVAPLVEQGFDEEEGRRSIGLYIPIETEGGLFGILKVVKVREGNVIYKEEVQLLQNLTGFIPIYMNQLQMPRVIGRMEELGKLFNVHKEIFSSLVPLKIAITMANLLPDVIQCQRCTIALFEGKRLRIKAITGQDLIEQKSVTIRSLTRILQEAVKREDPLTLTPESLENMEDQDLKEAGEEYFGDHPFKVLHATPIRDKEQDFGVVSIESIKDEGFSTTDLTFLKFVSGQAALAFKNAKLFQGIPLSKTWEKLSRVSEKVGLMPWAKRIIILLIILAIIVVPFIVSVENKVSGKCEIMPIQRYYARAKTEGILKTFQIQEGNLVKKGDVVATLDDEPLQKRLREVLTRKDVSRANMGKYFGLGQMADYEIERLRLRELEVEIEYLQSEIQKTRIVSEGPGVVITPQPRFMERIGKPVAKGEELIEVGELDRLQLEVAVDEKDIQLVKVGQDVRFLLNSIPEQSFDVKVKTIREKAEVKELGNFFVIESELNSLKGPFKPGMKGEARIYTGKAPLGKVFFRDMIDWFRMKMFKWF